jgi:hypothetical protein
MITLNKTNKYFLGADVMKCAALACGDKTVDFVS